MNWKHISTVVDYRDPLGAVKVGESVRLSLMARPEEADESMEYEVALLMGEPDGSWKECPMNAEFLTEENPDCGAAPDYETSNRYEGANCGDCSYGPEDGASGQIVWSCEWTAPEQPGVYWYYFRIRREDILFFYGVGKGRTAGSGEAIAGAPSCYQLTVYEKEFETPEWFRNATMYQIFPDRYCRGDERNLDRGIRYHQAMGREVHAHKNWEEIPYYHPLNCNEFYYPGDFFGGDLEGIRRNLDHLKEMGITCLYLNPIVEADSNHRYNTADYKKVDPVLGTNEDFRRLCREAEKKGIRILLDGVYSHTGADSIYFNKKRNYPEPGAYQEMQSPYDSWYQFEGDREHYKSWWGFDSLPEVNELDPAWQDFVITGQDSVFAYWLENGAGGFRLDVADELPDEVIELMRTAVKKASEDNVLLGEVWEDATIKESYGKKRTYALGRGLDSVMNYPFRNMAVAWLTGWSRAGEVADFLNAQRANYPKPMYYALMNLLSSHDVARIRTVLGSGTEGREMERREQADFVLDHHMERRGDRLTRLATALQFILPGVPSVYYGDEYGMCGFGDPFNRGPFEMRDPSMAEYVKELSLLRQREELLRSGSMSARAYGERILAILRCGGEDGCILTVFNPCGEEEETAVRLSDFAEGLTQDERRGLKQLEAELEGKEDVRETSAEGTEEAEKCEEASGIRILAASGRKKEVLKVSCRERSIHVALKPFGLVVVKLMRAGRQQEPGRHYPEWRTVIQPSFSQGAFD